MAPGSGDGVASGDAKPAVCPMRGGSSPTPRVPTSSAGACPYGGPGGPASSSSKEELDPRNMMPKLPQTPAADQTVPLSKQRETSTIPKGDEEGNWVYPSPQQFYHALKRKNKEVPADAMDSVVHAHNVTNERTWMQIMEWEKLHYRQCKDPKLLRFVGRSDELSLGAQWSKRFSYRGVPFDRHDWYVDRCGIKTVRYVIDYYDDPHIKNDDLQVSIDTRPAFDDLGNAWDRLRSPVWQAKRMWSALFG